jgi:hypothetical protein
MKRSTIFAGLVAGVLFLGTASARAQQGGWKIGLVTDQKIVTVKLPEPVVNEESKAQKPVKPSQEDAEEFVNTVRLALRNVVARKTATYYSIVRQITELHVNCGNASVSDNGIHFDMVNNVLDVYYSSSASFNDLRDDFSEALENLATQAAGIESVKASDQKNLGSGINNLDNK